MAGLELSKLENQLNWYSGSVSNAVRTTAFGVIAALWAVFTADGLSISETVAFGIDSDNAIRFTFIFAAGGLLADIIQYVASYWMTSICYDRLEQAQSEGAPRDWYYNSECLGRFGYFLYRVGYFLFPTKLALAIFSALAFLIVAFGINTGT